MTKIELDKLLVELNDKLATHHIRATMYVYGGYAMCIHDMRQETDDIDGVFEPKTKIYELAEEIAIEKSLHANWLNDAMKGFISSNDGIEKYQSLSHLDIYVATQEHMLALKLQAIDNSQRHKDMTDFKNLIRSLKISDFDKLCDVVEQYIDLSRLLPQTQYWLEMEIFNDSSNH